MQFLMILVFAAHLLCVNVASAGPLVAAWLDWLEGRGNRLAGQAGRYLSWWALGLLLPGGLLGLTMGAMLWSESYRDVLSRLSNKIYFGVWELVFSLVLMLAHIVWWRARPSARGWERGLRITVALLASSNLLYHFPSLFSILEYTATHAEAAHEPITPADFRALLGQSAILSRVLHFVLAAIATCGVMLLGYALRLKRAQADPADVQRVAAWGGQIALIPSLLQLPVGMWLTASLSRPMQSAVTGNDLVATLLFLTSVALAIWMMQVLAAISIGDAERRSLIKAMALMVVVIGLMSGVLQRLREVALHQSNQAVSTQASTYNGR